MDAHPPETSAEQLQLYAVESFLCGCTDKNAAWLTCNVKNPTTISEAVNQMKLAQSSTKRMGVKYAVRSIAIPDDEALSDPEVRRIETPQSAGRCYRCGGRWHFARDCPNSATHCDICGGNGHNASQCVVRSDTHKSSKTTSSRYNGRSTRRSTEDSRSTWRPNRRSREYHNVKQVSEEDDTQSSESEQEERPPRKNEDRGSRRVRESTKPKPHKSSKEDTGRTSKSSRSLPERNKRVSSKQVREVIVPESEEDTESDLN